MSTYKGWEAEEQIAVDYLETCRSAVEDDEIFAKFKSLQGYKNILEHVTPRQGAEYLQVAMEMAGDALLENLDGFKKMMSLELQIDFLIQKRVKFLLLQSDTSKMYLRWRLFLENLQLVV